MMISSNYGMKLVVKDHERDLMRDYGQRSETTSVFGTMLKRLFGIKH